MISSSGVFEDEFETRIGISKEKLKKIFEKFLDVKDANENSDESLVINNCLNEICHGIKFSRNGWRKWFNHSREEVSQVYEKWKELHG